MLGGAGWGCPLKKRGHALPGLRLARAARRSKDVLRGCDRTCHARHPDGGQLLAVMLAVRRPAGATLRRVQHTMSEPLTGAAAAWGGLAANEQSCPQHDLLLQLRCPSRVLHYRIVLRPCSRRRRSRHWQLAAAAAAAAATLATTTSGKRQQQQRWLPHAAARSAGRSPPHSGQQPASTHASAAAPQQPSCARKKSTPSGTPRPRCFATAWRS